MEDPKSGSSFQPEAAFNAAAERFYELLKSFGVPAAATGKRADWSSLAGPLAGQFEQWLRLSQFASPWFSAAGPAAPGESGASPGAAAPWLFGALPLGPAAAQPGEAQRAFALLGELAQLQTRLAVHWSEIAKTAAERFVNRIGRKAPAASLEDALGLYELWVDCAEEAYAATVRTPEFARLQSELANASAGLLVEQRRQAESLVRVFGLPTRSEVDALYGQLRELREQLAQRGMAADPLAKAAASAPASARSARGGTRPKRAASAPRRRKSAKRASRRPRS
jgi:Poly(R)-hydroxyalkanoic acid synthase subunit (PHA_synth_III_E)